MCTLPELLAALCACLVPPLFLWSLYLQRKFYRALQTLRPALWAEFGTKGFFKYDESPKEAAAGWFLLAGQYHYLANDDLTHKGDQARWTTFAGISAMCLGLVFTSLPTYVSVVACLTT